MINILLGGLPWLHIVIFVPYELPCSHESHPHQNPRKTLLTSIFSFIYQIRCNVKSEEKEKRWVANPDPMEQSNILINISVSTLNQQWCQSTSVIDEGKFLTTTSWIDWKQSNNTSKNPYSCGILFSQMHQGWFYNWKGKLKKGGTLAFTHTIQHILIIRWNLCGSHTLTI